MSFAFQFEAVLKRQNIAEEDLPIRMKKKIKEIRALRQELIDGENIVKEDELAPDKKAELEQKIKLGKAAESEMDQEIIAGIKKWIPNKEAGHAKAQRMVQANEARRAAKAATGPPAPATPAPAKPAPVAAPQPAKQPDPPKPAPAPARQADPPKPARTQQNEPPATTGDDGKEKKKMGAGAWALWILGGLVLGGAGVFLAKKISERNQGL